MKSRSRISVLCVILVLACLGSITINASAQDYQQLWAPDGKTDDGFGIIVSGWEDVVVLGAWYHDAVQGAAYVYRKSGNQWVLETKLQASDKQPNDRMGSSVSIHGDVIISGAALEDHDGLVDAGAAYVYRWDGTQWQEEAKLTASDGIDGQYFGWSVAAVQDFVAVGAPAKDPLDVCSVYVFRKVAGTWVEEAKLVSSDGAAGNGLGFGVFAFDNRVFGGALHDSGKGALFVFRYEGGVWTEEAKLVASDGASGDELGNIVSANGDRVAVGARHHHHTGACYTFRRSGTTWVEEDMVEPSDSSAWDWYGHGVSVRGDRLAVGSLFNDGSGSTYLYSWNGSEWTGEVKLHDPSLPWHSRFGHSVALQDEYFVVGAPQCGGNPGINIGPGTAYVYDESYNWSWINYGAGWPGTHGIPRLMADTSLPPELTLFLGNSRRLSTIACLFYGLTRTQTTTPLGGELLLIPSSMVIMWSLPPAGLTISTSITTAMPDNVYLQALEFDPGASRGVSFTPGMKLTF
ncbi:MAG: hypothetical protein ABIK28_04295 [Planctomycetota bacterium]